MHNMPPMRSAFELASNLHKHTKRTSLLNKAMQRLKRQEPTAFRLNKDEIREVKHISHFLYSVDIGRLLLVSMVFNQDDILRFVTASFDSVVINRTYQDIWYDLDMR